MPNKQLKDKQTVIKNNTKLPVAALVRQNNKNKRYKTVKDEQTFQ